MKWVAISGSWRKMNKELENDVRRAVKEIITGGNGVVSGGALNVDSVALDEALKLNPTADRVKVFIPTTLETFAAHYRRRAEEKVITKEQAEGLIAQLSRLKKVNPDALLENKKNKVLDKETYYERNSDVVEAADELVAFHVNKSLGTEDTVDKALKKGIPVKVFEYVIE